MYCRKFASVAHLDRAAASDAACGGFESRQAHQARGRLPTRLGRTARDGFSASQPVYSSNYSSSLLLFTAGGMEFTAVIFTKKTRLFALSAASESFPIMLYIL